MREVYDDPYGWVPRTQGGKEHLLFDRMEAPQGSRIRPLDPTPDAPPPVETPDRIRGRLGPLMLIAGATVLAIGVLGVVRITPPGPTATTLFDATARATTTTTADGPTLAEQLPGFEGSVVIVSGLPDAGTVLVWEANASSPAIPFRTTAPRQAMLDVSGNYLLTLEVGKEDPILFVGTPSQLDRSYVGVTSAVWSASDTGRAAWIMRLPEEKTVALVTGSMDEDVLVMEERVPFEIKDGDRVVGWDGFQFLIQRSPLRPAIVTIRDDPDDPASARTVTLSKLLMVNPDGVIRATQPAALIGYGRDQSVLSSSALALLDQLDRGRTLEEFGFDTLSQIELIAMPKGLYRVTSWYFDEVSSLGELSNTPTGVAVSTDGRVVVEGRYDRKRDVTDLYSLSRFTPFRSVRGYFVPMGVDDHGQWVIGSQEPGQVVVLGIESDAALSIGVEGLPILAEIVSATTAIP